MTQNAILVIKTLFNSAYSLLTSFVLPGTRGVTPLSLILFSTLLVVSIKFIKRSLDSGEK